MKKYKLDSQPVVLATIEKVYQLLKPTYGKNGKGVVIGNFVTANVIDDGYKILESIEFEDPFENEILRVIKEATRRMNHVAGDGTTTVIMLLTALLREFYSEVRPIVESDFVKSVNKVCETLVEESIKVSTLEELKAISLNAFNHPELSNLIAEMVWDIGGEGEVAVQESDEIISSVDRQQGFTFERGMVNPYMLTKSDGTAELVNPLILVSDQAVVSLQEILPFLKQVAEDGQRSLLVIADTIEGGALNGLLVNKQKGLVLSVAVKAPFSAKRKKDFFEDVALITGATVITADKGVKLKNATLGMCGTADRVIVTENKTTIIGGAGKDYQVKQRAEELKKVELTDAYDKEMMAQRIAQLTNSVAVLKVGGITDPERRYLQEKADDAIRATQLAMREGMSKGAGVALSTSLGVSGWFDIALGFPRKVLVENGLNPVETVYDPTGVLVAVVQTASSIALTLIKSSGIITDDGKQG